jgi:small nuclear ribonucleoprotein (snRNP)-like protein
MSEPFETAPDPVPTQPVGDPWAAPVPPAAPVDDAPTQPVSYAPTADRRPAWAATEDDAEQAPRPTPEHWFDPASTEAAASGWTRPAPAALPAGGGNRGGTRFLGVVVVVSLVSATLASAGTYGLLRASGSIDQPAATPAAVRGQTVTASQPAVDEQSAITVAAANVSPAIVTITESGASGSPNDPFGQVPTTGIGSGVIFDSNGWIVTNKHVVAGSTQLEVALQDGRQFSGTIYGIDTLTDLAIVKVEATGLPTAPIGNSSTAKVGQLAIAIGSPLGTYTNSVTAGIISAFGAHHPGPGWHPDQQPHPDGCGDQPGQLGRRASRRQRRRRRHQHRRRPDGRGDRLRDPDQHRQADHGAGPRRPEAGASPGSESATRP